MTPVSKLQQAKDLFRSGKVRECFKLVSTWRPTPLITRAQLAVIRRAHECFNFPQTYAQMGFNAGVEIEKAKTLFSALFMRGEEGE